MKRDKALALIHSLPSRPAVHSKIASAQGQYQGVRTPAMMQGQPLLHTKAKPSPDPSVEALAVRVSEILREVGTIPPCVQWPGSGWWISFHGDVVRVHFEAGGESERRSMIVSCISVLRVAGLCPQQKRCSVTAESFLEVHQ